MRLLRRKLFDKNKIVIEYGCGAHPQNKFCVDIIKLPFIKPIVKSSLYVSKFIK